jgi:hypothetical protein
MRGELVTGRAGCASGSDRPAGREYTDGSVTSCAAESSCAGLGEGTLRVGRLSRPRASRPHRAGAGFSRLSADLEGHPWVRASDHQGMVRGTWAGAAPRTWAIESRSQRFGEPLAPPDSVRHMSVTTATQRLTAAHHETQRHNSKKARETGKTQLTGRLRRWWQVLGSNQRRLSRRFSERRSPPIGIPTDLRILHSSPRQNPRSVRPASVHTKSPRSARRGFRVPVQGSPAESRCVPTSGLQRSTLSASSCGHTSPSRPSTGRQAPAPDPTRACLCYGGRSSREPGPLGPTPRT